MRVLEVIHLRSAGNGLEDLYEPILDSLKGLGDKAKAFALFRRLGLRTDLAIHIRGSQPGLEPRRSKAALRLAQSLKQYGMVEHAVWEELEHEGSA